MILHTAQVGKALLGCCLTSACLLSSALPAAIAGEVRWRDSALTKVEKERCILLGLDESAMVRVKKTLGSTFDLVDLEDQKLVTSSLDCVFDEAEFALVLRDWRRIAGEYPQFAILVKKEEARFRKVNLLRNGCTLPGCAVLSNSDGSVKLVARLATIRTQVL